MNKKKKKRSTSKPASTPAKTDTAAASSQPASSNANQTNFGTAVLVSVLFYEVMVAFWIPLFLAAVLVVVFRPWYDGIRARFKLGDAVAALLTTASVLLIVLIPLAALLVFATVESQQVLRQFNSTKVLENAKQVRTKLGLELPLAMTQTQVEIENLSECSLDTVTANRHQASLFEIEQSTDELADFWELKRPAPATLLADSQETPNESTHGKTISPNWLPSTNSTTLSIGPTSRRVFPILRSASNDSLPFTITSCNLANWRRHSTTSKLDNWAAKRKRGPRPF